MGFRVFHNAEIEKYVYVSMTLCFTKQVQCQCFYFRSSWNKPFTFNKTQTTFPGKVTHYRSSNKAAITQNTVWGSMCQRRSQPHSVDLKWRGKTMELNLNRWIGLLHAAMMRWDNAILQRAETSGAKLHTMEMRWGEATILQGSRNGV